MDNSRHPKIRLVKREGRRDPFDLSTGRFQRKPSLAGSWIRWAKRHWYGGGELISMARVGNRHFGAVIDKAFRVRTLISEFFNLAPP